MKLRVRAAWLVLPLLTACSGGDRANTPDGHWDPVVILVTGENFEWNYRFAGADGIFDTGDDFHVTGDLHLPQARDVVIRFTSLDYVYTFNAPDFDVREAAIPDLTFSVALRPGRPGRFDVIGDRMCGYTHEGLNRTLVVEPEAAFFEWAAAQRDAAGG